MRLKSWASNIALAVVAVVAIGIVTGIHVRTQAPFLVFGSSSGSSQVIKSTANALWVSLQAAVLPVASKYGFTGVSNGFGIGGTGTSTVVFASDGGGYLYTDPGSVTINSAVLKFAAATVTQFAIGGIGVSGQATLLNGAQTAGIGIDVATDATLKIRTRAQTGYGTVDSGLYNNYGLPQIVFVTTDFSTAANTNLQIITGLTWTLPATTAINIPFRCVIFYSQATAAVSDSFGVQTDTVTPSNFQAGGSMETALGTTAYGDATIANTTATAVVTGTPSATGTIFNAYVDGFLENPSNASPTILSVQVKTSVSGDVITVKRGSFCRAF